MVRGCCRYVMYVLLNMNYAGRLKSSMYLLHEAVTAANTLLAMGPVPLGGQEFLQPHPFKRKKTIHHHKNPRNIP